MLKDAINKFLNPTIRKRNTFEMYIISKKLVYNM